MDRVSKEAPGEGVQIFLGGVQRIEMRCGAFRVQGSGLWVQGQFRVYRVEGGGARDLIQGSWTFKALH